MFIIFHVMVVCLPVPILQCFASVARQELDRLYGRYEALMEEIGVTVDTFGIPGTTTIDLIFNDILSFGTNVEKVMAENLQKKKEEEAEANHWNPWVIEEDVEEEVVEESPTTGLMDKLIFSIREGDFRLE
eukprot:TRINITY_DN8306_c0_g1_i14.p1 TRINITY_DN8306_c0_g1~~TRINITY_DN8306_c0_g1_i14.p1  ORF type:complete len:131 (-),score=42.78 TRINITY_DN8306_c0_g1_i14:94-486(-)